MEGRKRARQIASFFGLLVAAVSTGAAIALTRGWIAGMFIPVALGVLAFLNPVGWILGLVALIPAYDLVIVRLGGTADIRIAQFAWLAAWVGLLAKRETRTHGPGRVAGIAVLSGGLLVMQELVSAAVSGNGLRAFVEVSQTVYLLLVGWSTAVVAKTLINSGERRSLLSVAAVRLSALAVAVMLLISVLMWAGVVSPPPRVIVNLSGGIDISVAPTRPHMFEASYAGIAFPRFRILNTDSVFTAAWLLALIAVLVGSALDPDAPGRRKGAVVGVWSASVLLVATLSRAAWVVAGLATGMLALRSGFRGARIVSTVLLAAVVFAWASPAMGERAKALFDTTESSFQTHLTMWGTAVGMAAEKPLFGWGPGSFKEIGSVQASARGSTVVFHQTDAHSFVLQEAAESGLPGALMLTILVGSLLVVGYPAFRSGLSTAGVWVALCAIVVMGLTMNIIRTELFASFAGAVLGCSDSELVRRRAEAPNEIT